MSKSIGSVLLAFLAITAAAVPARADVFNFTASIQTFTVSTTGIYTITSAGAQGGPGYDGSGGLGAIVSGDVLLTAGTVLDIVVGQEGGGGVPFFAAAGGGGGSFVYEPLALQPLEAAGGGGGAGIFIVNGNNALPGTSGGDGGDAKGGAGGVSGGGGAAGFAAGDNGGGGAGWTGNGGTNGTTSDGGGGQTASSWAGGAGGNAGAGGYGGGGGAGVNSGGGGGGYSGGGGGNGFHGHGGGGGGSYIDPSFIGGSTSITIGQTGDGFVSITPDIVATPEPGSLLLLASAAMGLALTRLRKARTQ